MSVSTPSPTGADAMATGAACYAGMVRELAEMGMDIAREHHRTATVPRTETETATETETGDAGAESRAGEARGVRVEAASRAFDRAARCVRRTILLARTLETPAVAKAPDECSRSFARRHIIRALEDEIHNAVPDAESREALTAELHERLDGPDVADDLDDRPLHDIIREIKRDLGVGQVPGLERYKRRTPADIAVLCARAEERGQGAAPVTRGAVAGPRPPDERSVDEKPGNERSGDERWGAAEAERFFRLLGRP